MIKVSVMYPNGQGVRFDHVYYRDRHLPLIKKRMGAGLKYYTIDKGLTGAEAEMPAPYVAMCHLICESVESYRAAFGPHALELSKDVRNFTDRIPVTQISEIVVDTSLATGAAGRQV